MPGEPGPLPEGFAIWKEHVAPEAGDAFVKTPELEGSTRTLLERKRLRMVD